MRAATTMACCSANAMLRPIVAGAPGPLHAKIPMRVYPCWRTRRFSGLGHHERLRTTGIQPRGPGPWQCARLGPAPRK